MGSSAGGWSHTTNNTQGHLCPWGGPLSHQVSDRKRLCSRSWRWPAGWGFEKGREALVAENKVPKGTQTLFKLRTGPTAVGDRGSGGGRGQPGPWTQGGEEAQGLAWPHLCSDACLGADVPHPILCCPPCLRSADSKGCRGEGGRGGGRKVSGVYD